MARVCVLFRSCPLYTALIYCICCLSSILTSREAGFDSLAKLAGWLRMEVPPPILAVSFLSFLFRTHLAVFLPCRLTEFFVLFLSESMKVS